MSGRFPGAVAVDDQQPAMERGGSGDHLAGVPELLSDPSIVLHVYGKRHAVARRKMGHFTMLVDGPVDDAAIALAKAAHSKLHWTT